MIDGRYNKIKSNLFMKQHIVKEKTRSSHHLTEGRNREARAREGPPREDEEVDLITTVTMFQFSLICTNNPVSCLLSSRSPSSRREFLYFLEI